MRVPRHLSNSYEQNFYRTASAAQLFNGGVYSPAFFSREEAQVVIGGGFAGLGFEVQRSVIDPLAFTGAPVPWQPVELQYLTDSDVVADALYHAEYSVSGNAWWRVGIFTDTLTSKPPVRFCFNTGGTNFFTPIYPAFPPVRRQYTNTAYMRTVFTTAEGDFLFMRNYPDGATGLVVNFLNKNNFSKFPIYNPDTGEGQPLSADPNYRKLPPSRLSLIQCLSDFIANVQRYNNAAPFTIEEFTERDDFIRTFGVGA